MPNYIRHYVPGHPVFITVVTHRRQPWLAVPEHAEQVMAAMHKVKLQYPFRHLAQVLMPDHLHWMLKPADGDFSRIVAAVKREVSWRMKPAGPLWQRRFHDHVIRDETDFQRHLDYLHYNPVKHGHAACAADWPFSSFRAWVARERYELNWGSAEPDHIREMALD